MLPLPPATFHILMSVADEDRHGYAIIQDVAARTDGELKLSAGTLYRSIQRMLDQGLIAEARTRPAPALDDERRRYYSITPLGIAVARAEMRRLTQLVRLAKAARAHPGDGMMRFYRTLLHLYPVSFRAEYGRELYSAFEREHGGRHGIAALTMFLAALGDVVPNAFAVHWDILRQDLRYMRRAIRQAPGFAITAVLVVALGVGANTAAFSVADFVLVRPLPFPHPERLVKLWETTPGYDQMELSPGNYRDWKADAKSFAAMGAYTTTAVNLTGPAIPSVRRRRQSRATCSPYSACVR